MIFNSKKNSVNILAKKFPTDKFPVEKAVFKTTVQIGKMRYRSCAAIFLNKEGFYLRIRYIFKNYPDIFIPWRFISRTKKSKLYSLKAIKLVLSDTSLPTIKIYEQYFDSKFIKP